VSDTGAFVLIAGVDTVAIERFTRGADSVRGDLTIKNQGRFTYTAALGPKFTISHLTMAYFGPNVPADAPAAQTAVIDIRGDSAFVQTGGRGGPGQRIKTEAGAIMSLPSSFVTIEQVTMRARAAGGTADIPVFATSGGQTITVNVHPAGSDTLLATFGPQVYRLAVDATGRILGGNGPNLRIARVGADLAARISLGKPDYSAPNDAPYRAEEVTVKGPAGSMLGGTLTLPKNASGPVAAIVTITGSGQEDRDEYIPVAGGYRPFRQVADTLGRRGIAVLRMDDRGIGLSNGPVTTATSVDFADDIRAGVAYLRSRKDIDPNRIGLVGHSEGGLIAPMVAASDPKLKGIVLLAGPAYNGLDIIRFQQRFAIDHDTSIAPARRDAAYKKAATSLDSMSRTMPWMKFFLAYDPLTTAKNVRTPTLILQGGTDRQVTAEQAEKLGAAIRGGGNTDVTVKMFPGKNHLFIDDPDGNATGYAKLPTNKMAAEVLGTLADWLVTKLR
jgi:dienelactone hydrolase